MKSPFQNKETGKGLSSNDFTDTLKTKLDGLGAVDVETFALELARKNGENSYMEMTYTGDDVTGVDYWKTSAKTTKLFTKVLTYTSGVLTSITVTDNQTSKVLTTTISYSGDTISSITKVVS